MASVVSFKELSRKGVFEVRRPRILTREFVAVLSDDALTSAPITDTQIATALGVNIGSAHPEYNGYRVRKATLTEGYEGSPYHVHLVAEYGLILASELTAPTSRPAVWEFVTQAGEVPALYYYEGSGNGTTRPLTNSAFDYFPGLVAQEALITAKVTYNFSTLPTSWIASQNFVNDSGYLGCPAHTIKVIGVTVQQEQEEFGGGPVAYWKATAELGYRQSSHNLLLPDVGWNFIGGGQKRRAMVFDFNNAEWVPSPNPVGLDGNGGLTNGAPVVLNRRVNPVADFQSLFGSPPTTPLPF